MQGTLIPLLPNALVAPDEMEKNSNPLYRCGAVPAGWRGWCWGRVSAAPVFCQLSGGGPGQPEGFQGEHVHAAPQRHIPVGAAGCVPHGGPAAMEPEG